MVTQESLRKIEKDFDFEKLELHLKLPNIFRILKISKSEIRHSNFLAWLLNPNESHNLRDTFLKHFLLDNDISIDSSDYQNIEIKREWKNIDLLITTNNIAICIENKIESLEHSNQLERYKETVSKHYPNLKKHFVFLTANNSEPSDEEYTKYSYFQIVDTLQNVLNLYERRLTFEVKQYIKDYIDILKIDVMKEDELNDLSRKIYAKHKEAFEFIFENKPDLATDFYPYFENKVIQNNWIIGSPNKGYIRFLTKPLIDVLPKMKGYKLMESLTFEIDFFWYNQKQICFATVIAPGSGTDEDNNIIKLLNECLSQITHKYHKKPRGKKWLVHFRKRWNFDLEDMSEREDYEIYEAIEKFWHEIEEMVYLTEKTILSKKDDFLKLRNAQKIDVS